jgi:AraC-like DNA-binding protein
MGLLADDDVIVHGDAERLRHADDRLRDFDIGARRRSDRQKASASRPDLMPLVAELKDLLARPEDVAGHAVRPGPALRFLDVYLQSLTSLNEPPPSELAPIIRLHLLDLVGAALRPTAEAVAIVAKRGVKAARVRAILGEIARRFSDPDFDLDRIARTLGLSRRYIQQLLEETGKSFVEHLVERRLERSFAMLTDRRCLHLAIIDIAFAAGFGDVSNFNRVFRRRFGETPSSVRAAAIGPRQK